VTATARRAPTTPADFDRRRGQCGLGRPSWSANVEVIERERVLRGWTQRELARRAHVDPGTLSDLLGRRRRATFGTMQAICSSLNLTLVQMITFQTDVE
jgi:DNA-binding Xre family transcriptional regulator